MQIFMEKYMSQVLACVTRLTFQEISSKLYWYMTLNNFTTTTIKISSVCCFYFKLHLGIAYIALLSWRCSRTPHWFFIDISTVTTGRCIESLLLFQKKNTVIKCKANTVACAVQINCVDGYCFFAARQSLKIWWSVCILDTKRGFTHRISRKFESLKYYIYVVHVSTYSSYWFLGRKNFLIYPTNLDITISSRLLVTINAV